MTSRNRGRRPDGSEEMTGSRCAPALVLATVILAGCAAAPTRDQPAEFKLMGSGQVPAAQLGAFSDCVMDGFDKAHTIPTAFRARKVQRSTMTRVESMLDNSIAISADIHNDGRVALYESSIAALVNLASEKQAFAACLKNYAGQ